MLCHLEFELWNRALCSNSAHGLQVLGFLLLPLLHLILKFLQFRSFGLHGMTTKIVSCVISFSTPCSVSCTLLVTVELCSDQTTSARSPFHSHVEHPSLDW